MKINWSSLYRQIYRKLNTDQKVAHLYDELSILKHGIEILEKLTVLSDKYNFDSVEELETILEKGEIKK